MLKKEECIKSKWTDLVSFLVQYLLVMEKKSIVLKNIGSSLTKKYIKSFYMGEMFVLYDIKMIHYSKIKKLHEFISLINLC